jgi:lysophospholipase L1-like esterase
MRYLALGDSYTIGEGVAQHERWPVQLARLLQADGLRLAEVTLIAETGWTTAELMAGIEGACPTGEYELVTLLIGVNNQYRGLSRSEYRQEFAALLGQAVGFAGNEPARVIVLSIPDWGVMPFAQGRNRASIGEEIDAFNEVNREETMKRGVNYLDVTGISRRAANDPALIAGDGLHPSGRMYSQWAEQLLPIASQVLIRATAAGKNV